MLKRAVCVKEVGGEYITVGQEYTYRLSRNESTVHYNRVIGGAGSWMTKCTWDRAVAAGAIVLV